MEIHWSFTGQRLVYIEITEERITYRIIIAYFDEPTDHLIILDERTGSFLSSITRIETQTKRNGSSKRRIQHS